MEIQQVNTRLTDFQIAANPKPSRLEFAAEMIAEQGINNQKSIKELTPPPRFTPPQENNPVPANLYAKLLVDAEEQYKKEIRLQQGPALLEERYTPLRDTPLVDEMYQLFLSNQHIDLPQLNKARETYYQEVVGAEGAQGDMAMAPEYEDMDGILRNGISLDGLPSAYSVNPDFSMGVSVRGDDLYREILDNIHLDERTLKGMLAPPTPDPMTFHLEKGAQVSSEILTFSREYGVEIEGIEKYKEKASPVEPIRSEAGGESREGLLSAKMILGGNPNSE